MECLEHVQGEGDEDYRAFVEKFKPKKTTDDCYTPDRIYEAVAKWVENEYGVARDKFVRPFYPGGDYERFHYPDGCVVVDNPPFSILAKIVAFYNAKRILYFLFAPTLTLFSGRDGPQCYIPVNGNITYANGAKVNTSFLTNLETGIKIRSAPTLYQAIECASQDERKEKPVNEYPNQVLTSSRVGSYSRYGIDFCVPDGSAQKISTIGDEKYKIFGNAYILNDEMTEKKLEAERKLEAAKPKIKCEFSASELEMLRELNTR